MVAHDRCGAENANSVLGSSSTLIMIGLRAMPVVIIQTANETTEPYRWGL